MMRSLGVSGRRCGGVAARGWWWVGGGARGRGRGGFGCGEGGSGGGFFRGESEEPTEMCARRRQDFRVAGEEDAKMRRGEKLHAERREIIFEEPRF